MDWREGTADFNNLRSCMDEDEYALRDVEFSGTAVDVGAHIGGVTVSLALDHPQCRVIAVEALSENVTVLERNVEQNGLGNVTVLHRAAAEPGRKRAKVEWNFRGNESGDHHRYIGNAVLPPDATRDSDSEMVQCIDLTALVAMAGGRIDFMKIDAEGAEYPLFADQSALYNLGEIRGEFHAGWAPLVALLERTHIVHLLSGTDHFGGFKAVPR